MFNFDSHLFSMFVNSMKTLHLSFTLIWNGEMFDRKEGYRQPPPHVRTWARLAGPPPIVSRWWPGPPTGPDKI